LYILIVEELSFKDIDAQVSVPFAHTCV